MVVLAWYGRQPHTHTLKLYPRPRPAPPRNAILPCNLTYGTRYTCGTQARDVAPDRDTTTSRADKDRTQTSLTEDVGDLAAKAGAKANDAADRAADNTREVRVCAQPGRRGWGMGGGLLGRWAHAVLAGLAQRCR